MVIFYFKKNKYTKHIKSATIIMGFTNPRLHIHDKRFKAIIAIHHKKSGQMQSVCHGLNKSFNASVAAYRYDFLGCFPLFLILLQSGHVSKSTA